MLFRIFPFVVMVREHFRRPPGSFGFGPKTVAVRRYWRRYPRW
jgi:hypothetical protein